MPNYQYRTDNKEKRKECNKKYYNDNKENNKQYRIDNKQKIKQYRIDNKEKIKQYKQYQNSWCGDERYYNNLLKINVDLFL